MAEQKEKEHLLKNTIDEERLHLCDVVRRLGSKLSGLMLVCGILVLIFGVYVLVEPQGSIASSEVNIIFIGTLGFLGALNILCGLLLLLGED